MIVQLTKGAYGIGMDWTLVVYGRRFYLGQDVKFCSRVLGVEPRYVIDEIGTDRLYTKAARVKLARLIVEMLNITRSNVKSIEPWGLCAQ